MFGIINRLFGDKADLQSIIEEGAVILDVRTAGEYQSGHVKGSINMPLDRLNIATIQRYNKPIITCCASGMRSGVAAKQLKAAGIETYNGGSWNSVAKLMK